ncbi:Acetyl-/propionyl-coenzyme A carboxylase alpha chain [Actinomadura rubteroloni]|uniref:Biotin-dependent 3-methylcrotonyl-coenzyme A carboxylase alpha1 subunit n=1 Tax=Actinomadura rubteroloni TaxID=1926885 RepID=A0A2P4UEC7_9ACTN|nr:biotin carboxylase N-terminal domain-containing protein [Actinomadura rubteroloni]POM23410.1 Acetyl-/propionyl-coenzyme A carboxylase alpha chain [Actinomadura rubteroloni]
MFGCVLVANRGEIAVRVVRTLRRLGVRSVAVHTAADTGAPHVRAADEAVLIPSYLDADAVLAAARATGAEAVHPGYGFLAENGAFARACAEAGVVFVGPPADAIDAMGDKIRAKRTVAAAGVPVVPGRNEPGLDDDQLAAAALEVGLPVLLKPSAGGGGKGMRLVRDPAALPEAIAAARREARAAFGDDTLLAERYVDSPRHIEIQVFADAHGNVVHLGERECSLQRRHQKIVEEAPSPLLDAATRARMGASAVAAARAVGYTGAGTVEYIVSADRPGEYFFMEMNTRLQVEHPVTEMAIRPRLDLVELQLQVAAGEPLPFGQDDVAFEGHAVEARVYAEDPARGFLPTGGRVLALAEPGGPGIRVDSGLAAGVEVGGAYDPMLAKVVAHGPDRAAALRRLDRALAAYTLLGVPTNVAFLRTLLARPDVAAGRLDTGLAERAAAGLDAEPVPPEVLAAAALDRMLALETGDPDPWAIPDGWRPGGPAWTRWTIVPAGGAPVEVRVRGRAADALVRVGDAEPVRAALTAPATLAYDGRTVAFARVRAGDVLWLGRDGRAWALTEHVAAEEPGGAAAGGDGVLRSPMPGTVLAVKVAEGDRVEEGQAVAVVEAMKMEHTVAAPSGGVVTRLAVRAGDRVALDAVLAEIGEG